MSKAYKCDVCGKLFESRLVPFWIKSAIKPNETLDICDSCKAEFEHWLDPTKYEECEEDDRSCSKCIHSDCCPSDLLEDPCKYCDNYSNYVEDMRSCNTCIHHNCSPSEHPCRDCNGYSNYVNDKPKRCGDCVYLTCSVRNYPCSNCIRHEDRPNYVDKNSKRLCKNCTFYTCSPTEEPCVGCVSYSEYESWTDCVNLSKENNKKEVNNDV